METVKGLLKNYVFWGNHIIKDEYVESQKKWVKTNYVYFPEFIQ